MTRSAEVPASSAALPTRVMRPLSMRMEASRTIRRCGSTVTTNRALSIFRLGMAAMLAQPYRGAPRALKPGYEERHGYAGARRTLGGVGGHFGAPHA